MSKNKKTDKKVVLAEKRGPTFERPVVIEERGPTFERPVVIEQRGPTPPKPAPILTIEIYGGEMCNVRIQNKNAGDVPGDDALNDELAKFRAKHGYD